MHKQRNYGDSKSTLCAVFMDWNNFFFSIALFVGSSGFRMCERNSRITWNVRNRTTHAKYIAGNRTRIGMLFNVSRATQMKHDLHQADFCIKPIERSKSFHSKHNTMLGFCAEWLNSQEFWCFQWEKVPLRRISAIINWAMHNSINK